MTKFNWALRPLAVASFLFLLRDTSATLFPRQARAGNATTPQNGRIKLQGVSPKYPSHPDTTKYCSWWWDNDGSVSCKDIPDTWSIRMEDFLRWNPGLGPDCSNFLPEWSYCVEAANEPAVTNVPTKTTTGGSSPTKGIQTPTPTQPDMVDNCDAFAFVGKDMSCTTILSKNGITLKELVAWNPSVGSNCESLWANVYVCVSIVGHDPKGTTTTKPSLTTTAKPSSTNGIQTPSPIQSGMVNNCDKFAFVEKDQTCDTISKANGITSAELYKWNPSVGSTCGGLWANVYVCVSVIGHAPSTTKPSPTNGIETPSPIQEGMVKNCNKFHLVKTTTTCASIQESYKLPLATFYKWNPAVGSDCRALLASYYVCVMTVDYKPTPVTTLKPEPTKPSNGIATPSPIQANMHKNCNKFHLVKSTATCASICDSYKVPLKDFYSWNPSVGSTCKSLMAEYYVCVSIVGWSPPKPSPTSPGNGISTPSPIQTGMVKNCKKFYRVQKTSTCASIQTSYKVTMAQLAKWNPAIGSKCTALWPDYNICVGVIGQTPTQPPKTDPTPTPVQAGMIKNCKKFHLVKSTTTCASIQKSYKITMAQIAKWNPAVGAKCTALWKDYYVCVGV
ncbi:hypothetical protein G7Z17_g83 [Cylindrodendrum hubeiense]|uniref:LysM domain-containing protein n=1 Tax=Cylindrodendrum hubeiense TaxID=595255 RepID=A0A9P5HI87_9HYPO|nr:hypothetical protein G7Z17_g83 [Cylindrodendrum hubeiense]